MNWSNKVLRNPTGKVVTTYLFLYMLLILTLICLLKLKGVRNISSLILPEFHSKLKNVCREFSEAELRPVAAELDKQQKFPSKQVNLFTLLLVT